MKKGEQFLQLALPPELVSYEKLALKSSFAQDHAKWMLFMGGGEPGGNKMKAIEREVLCKRLCFWRHSSTEILKLLFC